MVWVTLKEAKERGLSRSALYRQIEAEEIPSQVRDGRRLVWFGSTIEERLVLEQAAWRTDRAHLIGLIKELGTTVKTLRSDFNGRIETQSENHREERQRWAQIITSESEENNRLKEELKRLGNELSKTHVQSIEKTKCSLVKPKKESKPIGRILPARHHEILRTIESLGLTFRQVEREAGLSKRFLTKAKLGQRSGPRSKISWLNIEAYLNLLKSEAA